MQFSHSNLDTVYFVMNSARVHSLLLPLSQVLLTQFVSRLSFNRKFINSILIRNYIFFIYKYFGPIVGFSACVLFNTPGPLLHLGPPGPGLLANPVGRYPTIDGKANTMAKPPDPMATSWPTTTILSGRSS